MGAAAPLGVQAVGQLSSSSIMCSERPTAEANWPTCWVM